ncbi:selenoprotein K-like [Paramacrobiotus metropolitanus]|uniref:selenoprotein K-like n=1 Tax=Paramacrobiotus metropolitanus TaxID=2943436 RepID=UPI0024462EA9|nr:selenoprotein K-like [Paramacrobiotus metropolitanus]XP_055340661.1 selenoprotein K-like [Paramacrobiotus metropolitanus]
MPYISGGEISNGRPWSLSKISDTFWSFIFGVIFFFKTLLPFLNSGGSSRSSSSAAGRTTRTPGPGRRMGGLPKTSGMSAPPCGAGG